MARLAVSTESTSGVSTRASPAGSPSVVRTTSRRPTADPSSPASPVATGPADAGQVRQDRGVDERRLVVGVAHEDGSVRGRTYDARGRDANAGEGVGGGGLPRATAPGQHDQQRGVEVGAADQGRPQTAGGRDRPGAQDVGRRSAQREPEFLEGVGQRAEVVRRLGGTGRFHRSSCRAATAGR